MLSGGNCFATVLLADAAGTQKTRRSRKKSKTPDIHGRPVNPGI
jgi:hypothetical protein